MKEMDFLVCTSMVSVNGQNSIYEANLWNRLMPQMSQMSGKFYVCEYGHIVIAQNT